MVERSHKDEQQTGGRSTNGEAPIKLEFDPEAVGVENRAIVAWLEDWLMQRDELGREWWDAFEQDLRTSRVTFQA